MCCRYWMEESPELRPIVEEMNRSPLVRKWHNTTGIKTSGEIRPTDVVPVIAPNKSGNRAVYPMKWGFSSKTLLMNARTETASSNLPSKNPGSDADASCQLPGTLNGNISSEMTEGRKPAISI